MKTEQERQDEFVSIVGGTRRADKLSKISQTSYPTSSWSYQLGYHQMSRKDVFIARAKREGFSDKEINCFLAL